MKSICLHIGHVHHNDEIKIALFSAKVYTQTRSEIHEIHLVIVI